MARADKPKRSAKTGQFEAWTPLVNPAFLSAVRDYVRAADALIPLVQSMADHAEPESLEWQRLRMAASLLDGMSSGMAGQLVAHGERLVFAPPVRLSSAAWDDPGDDDTADQCVRWCYAVRDVQWFYGQLGVDRKPVKEAIEAATQGDDDAVFAVGAYVVCLVLDGIKDVLLNRLGMASDKTYLKDAKKPALRLPLFGARLTNVQGG